MNRHYRSIILVWLLWAACVIGFQAWGKARLIPKRPDYAVGWSANETTLHSQDGKIYLNEPFMNDQVAWDSEFYVGVAVGGYEDPGITRTMPLPPDGRQLPLSYLSLPLYPYLMRLVALPLRLVGFHAIAAAAVAGVLVALLGTLAAMLALYELAKDELGEEGALRAPFYLLVFPSGFFLAQVYTEGLFLGLVFGTLALGRRGKWLPAVLCGAAATLTRAHGGLVILPLAWYWWRGKTWKEFSQPSTRLAALGKTLGVLAPAVVFAAWKLSTCGQMFFTLEKDYFSLGLLLVGRTIGDWMFVASSIFGPERSRYAEVTGAYYLIEAATVAVALATIALAARRYPELALFSLAAVGVAFFTGAAQAQQRYVLVAPVIFLVLARWGKSVAFDRTYTLLSGSLMMFNAVLFAYNYWVG